jgi:Tfp pilus assembly protein PilN
MFSKVSIGLDWNREGWSLVVLGKRLGRFRVVDRLQVVGPPEEARQAVAKFMDKHRIRDARMNACLPRRSLLVRFLDLPAEAEPQVAKVVGFQIDTLHPFQEGEVYWDCAVVSRDREKKLISVLVVIAEKSRLDQHYQELVGLGLRVTSMTLAAPCLVPILKTVTAEAALVVWGRPDGVELLGFQRGDLYATRHVAADSGEDVSERFERELHAVHASLPMADPTTVATFKWGSLPDPFAELLAEVPLLATPQLGLATPAGFDLGECWSALGAAYADLKGHAVAAINLLPAERRWRPTRGTPKLLYALGSLAVLLAIAAGVHPWVEEAFYARALNQQIHQWEPRAGGVRQQMQEAESLAGSADVLEGVRQQTWQKLQVSEELTKLLPDGTWLQEMAVDQETVVIFGYSDRAADLVQPLENSPYFSQVEFTSPITRDANNKEIFRIRMRLEQPVRP